MRLSDFDYNLPRELIAQYPLKERDSARLLVLDRKRRQIKHCIFKGILNYLSEDDLVVLNNSKVLPCRIIGRRLSGGRVELLLLKRKQGLTFNALIKPSRIKLSEEIIFNGGKILGRLTSRNEITFKASHMDEIYKLGSMPLPPYIKREPEDLDSVYYQTVYAKQAGSIASPTAGLHFTEELLSDIKSKGVNIAYIKLHVGYGTFKPVKVDDITKHKMEAESFKISAEALKLIKEALTKKRRIIAVGTTSCRVLETYAAGKSRGKTDLFIYPGYKFKLVDSLLTNFHLPATTLFMLACAFAGEKLLKRAYQEAIDKKYRFYSYGDAMLIL